MAIGRFSGEGAWEALINDKGLDIEEEECFRDYLRENGFLVSDELSASIKPELGLEELENAFGLWEKEAQ
jgi:hypothetical protein